jgi:hypothetical protein
VQLAGIALARAEVHELVDRLKAVGAEDTAALLLIAEASGEEQVGLTIDERVEVIAALADPPAGLEMLRAVLIQEHVWRAHEGL